MVQSEIVVGGRYTAKVSNVLTTVIVNRIEPVGGSSYRRAFTRYHCVNEKTGRKIVIRSAAKFRKPGEGEAQIIGTEVANVVRPSYADLPTTEVHEAAVERERLNPTPPNIRADVDALEVDLVRQAAVVATAIIEERPDGSVVAPPSPAPEEKKSLAPEEKPRFVVHKGPPVTPATLTAMQTQQGGPDTSPHLIVNALAGTGKTTTLVQGIRAVLGLDPCRMQVLGKSGFAEEITITPSPQQEKIWDRMMLSQGKARSIAFCCFNKSIADELQNRVPKECRASTMHALGNSAITRAFGRLPVEPYRTDNIISELLLKDIRELRRRDPEFVTAVKRMVELCKMNLIGVKDGHPAYEFSFDHEELDELAAHYDVNVHSNRSRIYDLLPRILERAADVQKDKVIDYNDMIWLPIILNLSVFQNDILLVDESQDLNRCQQALARKAGKRLILCGDPRQAIYGFAGADAKSMARMGEELSLTERGCETLPLTVTRRCGRAIVREANSIVPELEAHESNGEGSVVSYSFEKTTDSSDYVDWFNKVQEGDFILCRVNAPLVSWCFKFLKKGRKANIQGRDIGQGLISTIKKLIPDQTDRMAEGSIPALVGLVSDWLHKEMAKENAKRNPSEARLIGMQDRADCIVCFTDGLDYAEQVITKIESVFTDKTTDGIRLSSIHKAKGLEADRVFLCEPEGAGCPHPMARGGWQMDQEWNLRYVAITRAKKELAYVK